MVDRLITEHTTGEIVTADGVVHTRPTRILTPDAARTLRTYFAWALRASLEPELFCRTCFDHSRESKALYNISDEQITIVCGCAIRFYQGATPFTVPDDAPVPTGVDETLPMHRPLADAVATLIRTYKTRILIGLDLQEALRCNACYAFGEADGLNASVTTRTIRLSCRCTTRTFVGPTA